MVNVVLDHRTEERATRPTSDAPLSYSAFLSHLHPKVFVLLFLPWDFFRLQIACRFDLILVYAPPPMDTDVIPRRLCVYSNAFRWSILPMYSHADPVVVLPCRFQM